MTDIVERLRNVNYFLGKIIIADNDNHIDTAELVSEAADEVDRLRSALRLILPIAKGYASDHRVGSNAEYCQYAESVLSEVTK